MREVLGQNAQSQDVSCRSVAAEEGVGLPLGTRVAVGGGDEKLADDFYVECGGTEVNRLVDIVAWCVVALCEPILEDLGFGRARLGGDVQDDGGDAVADEIVLIAADEEIALRLRVGDDFDAEALCDGGDALAEV